MVQPPPKIDAAIVPDRRQLPGNATELCRRANGVKGYNFGKSLFASVTYQKEPESLRIRGHQDGQAGIGGPLLILLDLRHGPP